MPRLSELQIVLLPHGTVSRRPRSIAHATDFPEIEFEAAFLALTDGHRVPADRISVYFDDDIAWNGRPLESSGARPGTVELTHVLAGLGSVERRFETAGRADEQFRDAIATCRREGIARQDAASLLDELFCVFYSSILATVEGLGYALAWLPYLAGRRTKPPNPRSVSLGETIAEFRRKFRGEELAAALGEFEVGDHLSDIRAVRNMLEHRGAASVSDPQRSDDVGLLHAEPYLGRDLAINEELTYVPRAWVATTLRRVLSAVPAHMQKFPSKYSQ